MPSPAPSSQPSPFEARRAAEEGVAINPHLPPREHAAAPVEGALVLAQGAAQHGALVRADGPAEAEPAQLAALVLAEGPAVAEPAPAEDAKEDPPPAAAAAGAWWPSQEDFEAMALYQRRRLAMSRLTNFAASLLRPLHDDDFKDLSRKDAKKAEMLLTYSP